MRQLITALLLITIMQVVSAQEIDDIKTMHLPTGAVLRFVQLEKQLSLKILHGERVIETITGLDNASEITQLEDILDELRLIKQEVFIYTDPVNIANLTETAIKFVDLKNESITLINEFRTIAHELLGDYNLTELRAQIGRLDNNETKALQNRVKTLVKEYNAAIVRNTLKVMNVNAEEIANAIIEGNLTKAEIKEQVMNSYKNIRQTVKANTLLTIREQIAKKGANDTALLEQTRNNMTKRVIAQARERINNVRDSIKERIQNRIGDVNQWKQY